MVALCCTDSSRSSRTTVESIVAAVAAVVRDLSSPRTPFDSTVRCALGLIREDEVPCKKTLAFTGNAIVPDRPLKCRGYCLSLPV